MIQGRPAQAKRDMMREVTEAIVRTTGSPRESIRVILREVPGWHWSVGGVPKAEFPPEAGDGDEAAK
jgi:4-oxalocrotonate tautomerase